MTPFVAERTNGQPGGSTLLDRFLVAIEDTFRSLARAVTNDRIVPASFAAATTDVRVFHGLGCPPVSWEIVDRDADATVWRSPTENLSPDRYLLLQASAPVSVKIRFM